MRIATLNVQNTPDLSRKSVVECGRIARRHSDILLLQEIREAEDFDDIQKGLGSGFSIINHVSVPIAFRHSRVRLARNRDCITKYGKNNHGYFLFHKGDSDIPTPVRYGSFAIFETVARNSVTFGVSNGHPINKAWNGKERNPEIRAERQELWNESIDIWQTVVTDLLRAGLSSVYGGDFNRLSKGIPPFSTRERPVAINGIDQIYLANARKGARLHADPKEAERFDVPSDHDLLVNHVSLSSPRVL